LRGIERLEPARPLVNGENFAAPAAALHRQKFKSGGVRLGKGVCERLSNAVNSNRLIKDLPSPLRVAAGNEAA